MFARRETQIVLSAIIIIAAIATKVMTVNYWAVNNISNVYPWFMPYIFIGWSMALMGRLYFEKSRLFSVWIMALALLWYGFESFAVAGAIP